MTTQPPAPTCFWHPDRPTYLRCSRCDRYICPDCMRSAAVGQHCPACVREAAQTVRAPRLRPAAPMVTYTFIAISVVMFVVQLAAQDVERLLVLNSLAVADGQWYRLLTSTFLHFGPVHLLFNMWALYVVGPPLESALGRLRFTALYLAGALGGSVLVYLLAPLNAATAGASGAVFGLFAATLVIGRRLNLDVRWVLALIVINLVITFSVPGISWQGHIGGLVSGALVAALYVYPTGRSRTAVQVLGTLALLAVFAVLVVVRTGDLLSTFTLR